MKIWSSDANKNTNKTDGCSELHGGAADVLKFRLAAANFYVLLSIRCENFLEGLESN